MTVISAILAIFEAIPILDAWFQALAAAYFNAAVDRMKQENLDAIRKAIDEKDQRDLEKALGNPHAGEPSGIPNTHIRDSLPGVNGGGVSKPN